MRYNLAGNSWLVLNKSNAPAIGPDVQAFWTGSRLLAWDAYHRVGGLYNPGNDTWQTMSDINAPSAREGESGGFANSFFVVWGGREPEGGAFLNSGARYNPATDTWTATAGNNAPSPRERALATAIGTDLIVFGGRRIGNYLVSNDPPATIAGYSTLVTGGRYNPAANTWTPIADAPDGRVPTAASWSGSHLYAWGGTDYFSSCAGGCRILERLSDTGLQYHPGSNTWVALPAAGMPTGLRGNSAVWTGTEFVVWGGERFTNSGVASWLEPQSGGARFNPATSLWTPLSASGLIGRVEHAAVWAGSQMIVWGGNDSFGNAEKADGARRVHAAALQRHLPARQRLDQHVGIRRALRAQRAYAVWTGTEMIVWGGFGGFGGTPFNSGARFHVSSNRRFPVSLENAPRARTQHTAIWTGTEMIVWGGFDFTNIFAPAFLATGASYDPVTDRWTPLPSPVFVPGRSGHTAVWTGDEMIVWGGYSTPGGFAPPVTYYNQGLAWHPASHLWRALPVSGLSARRFPTAVWTGSEMILWGGNGASGVTNSGARYRPASNLWTPMAALNAAEARSGHTAVWANFRMILLGGVGSSTYLASRAYYDPYGDEWTPFKPASQRVTGTARSGQARK